MTTVVMARDYATAADAARFMALGQDWTYPHSSDQLLGLAIPAVVYVEGWLRSTTITTETAEAVQRQLTDDATVVMLPVNYRTRLWGDIAERQAAVSAPFIETVASNPLLRHPGPRPGLWRDPAWAWVLSVALDGSGIAALVAKYGQAVGWW